MEQTHHVDISIKGRVQAAPALTVDGRTIVLKGSWIKKAVVRDELYLPNGIVDDPAAAIASLQQWALRPDIFEFVQRATERTPKFGYKFEWDNLAIVPISDYQTWLTTQAKRDVKENLRRANREGVTVRSCAYDDTLIHGLKALYDETPLRQGRPFWHFGKSFDDIKRDSGHYADRSEFIAAYLGDELIGFLKMVYVGDIAKTMYVISKEKHFHRRPANAMIAKAVEVCAAKGIKYFNYGVYDYPGKKSSSLTNFKRHHGFSKFEFPRYYVALTLKGRLYLALGIHRGFKRWIPDRALQYLMRARSEFHRRIGRRS